MKKVVKIILAVTVASFVAAGTVGCRFPGIGGNYQTMLESNSGNVTENTENVVESAGNLENESANNTLGNSQETSAESLVVQTIFEHSYDTGYEQATISGMKEDGTVVWTYVSGKYEPAQLDQVEEIGMHNGMYYLCEGSSIIALDLNTGEKVWENTEFEGGGVSFCFDEQGTLYISGYFSPDLMVIDKNGNTVLREAELDNSIHYWSYELSCEDGYVFVTYEACDDWNDVNISEEWWEYSNWGSYTLNYCLADGSVGLEYNRMEPSPSYNGRYTNDEFSDNADESLQIDYIGDNAYRMNLCIDGSKHLNGIVGWLKDGNIEFRATFDGGAVYAGVVTQATDALILKVTESTDVAIPAGSEITFKLKSEVVVAGQNTSYTMPDNWNYEFGEPRIGTFYENQPTEAGVAEAANGSLYGYEDWLTDGCSTWCGCEQFYCMAEASSALESQGNIKYVPSNAADCSRNTVWAEGVAGDGIGEYIEIRQLYEGLGEDVFTFTELCIVNGYAETENKWQENNRVKILSLFYGDVYMGDIHLEDTINPQYIDISSLQMKVENGEEAQFRFQIKEVYEGSKYDDTCITGIVIEFEGRQAH